MINIESETSFPQDLLERAARTALEHEAQSLESDLSIILTDDARLHELTLNYLGVDAATDVLSFPATETDPETGARYIGDILISIPRAQDQSDEAGHPLESEVQLLVVHGVLHLIGHDHAEADEKARMWKAQAEILKTLGRSEEHTSELQSRVVIS